MANGKVNNTATRNGHTSEQRLLDIERRIAETETRFEEWRVELDRRLAKWETELRDYLLVARNSNHMITAHLDRLLYPSQQQRAKRRQ